MSLAGRTDTREAIREFRGDTQSVAGYLMTEVLAKQPPAMREFLLRTCLLNVLEPGSVEALTGQPSEPRTLEFLARGNAFVEPVPGRPNHYRYQPLFREFLRSQLVFEDAALTSALHRKASEWLAQHGQPLAAIRHAADAQAWPMAAREFVEGLCYSGLLTGRQRSLQERLLGDIPAALEGVEAALTRAAFAVVELDARRADAELDAARTLLDRDPGAGSRACLTALAVLQAAAAGLGNESGAALEAAVVAEHAVKLMPVHDEVAHAELVAVAAGCKARALLRVGELAAAATALEEGTAAAQGPHLVGVLSQLMGLASLVEAMSGHLQRASGLVRRLLPPGEAVGLDAVPESRTATLALAWVRLDEYDLPAAETLLRLRPGTDPSLDATVLLRVEALLHARLWAARGEYDLARVELRAVSLFDDKRPGNSWLDHMLVIGQAELLLRQGAPEDAIVTIQGTERCEHVECAQLLQEALLATGQSTSTAPQPSPASLARQPLAVRVNALLLQAQQSIQDEDSAFAEIGLQTALQVAAPELLRRPFVEAPESIRSLLANSRLADHHHWLQGTSAAVVQDSGASVAGGERQVGAHVGLPGPAPLVNPLTKKEQEVLGYLADLLTTDEIAATMFVSVNTVRSHVRSVLRKLGVARRNEAVRRAWELQLLPRRDVA
jgi:LuxR family maltose regulon positive regulatory protein